MDKLKSPDIDLLKLAAKDFWTHTDRCDGPMQSDMSVCHSVSVLSSLDPRCREGLMQSDMSLGHSVQSVSQSVKSVIQFSHSVQSVCSVCLSEIVLKCSVLMLNDIN